MQAACFALAERAVARLRLAFEATRAAEPRIDVSFASVTVDVVTIAVPVAAAIGVTVVVAHALFERGVRFRLDRLAPDITRLWPKDPLENIRERLWSVVRALVLAAVVARGVLAVLKAHAGDLAALSRSSPEIALVPRVLAACANELAIPVCFAMAVLSMTHFAITKRSWKHRLRMSRNDIEREHRESEGDPQLRQARERVHRELLFSASLDRVRQASFVVTNPTHLACAIIYDPEGGQRAPELVARGAGEFAKRIIEAARDAGVPVFSDAPLARSLYELDVDQAIPESLYVAVATVLVELSRRP